MEISPYASSKRTLNCTASSSSRRPRERTHSCNPKIERYASIPRKHSPNAHNIAGGDHRSRRQAHANARHQRSARLRSSSHGSGDRGADLVKPKLNAILLNRPSASQEQRVQHLRAHSVVELKTLLRHNLQNIHQLKSTSVAMFDQPEDGSDTRLKMLRGEVWRSRDAADACGAKNLCTIEQEIENYRMKLRENVTILQAKIHSNDGLLKDDDPTGDEKENTDISQQSERNGQRDDRLRELQRVVKLAETELVKIKDNLKLTQEILPRHSPRQVINTSRSDLLKKLNMFPRGTETRPFAPIQMTSSEEYLKTISERTEVDITNDSFVFNVNVVPCRSVTNYVDVPENSPAPPEEERKTPSPPEQNKSATHTMTKVKLPIKYVLPKRKPCVRNAKSPKGIETDASISKLIETTVLHAQSPTKVTSKNSLRKRTPRPPIKDTKSRDVSLGRAHVRWSTSPESKHEDLKGLLLSARSVMSRTFPEKPVPKNRVAQNTSVANAVQADSNVKRDGGVGKEHISKDNNLSKPFKYNNCKGALNDTKCDWISKQNVRKSGSGNKKTKLNKPDLEELQNIESLVFSDSCQHLKFNYADPTNSINKPANLEVYIANCTGNPTYQPINRPRHKIPQVSRQTSPLPCYCGHKHSQHADRNAKTQKLKLQTCNFSIKNDRKRHCECVLAKCKMSTMKCVCIDAKSFTAEQVLNLDSNQCGNDNNMNTFVGQHSSRDSVRSELTTIACYDDIDEVPPTYAESDGGKCQHCLKSALNNGAKNKQRKNVSYDMENQTSAFKRCEAVDKANSPIVCARADCCIQVKASQRSNGVETMLVTDIPSKRFNGPAVTVCDDQIKTLFNRPNLDSTTDATADSTEKIHTRNAVKPCASCESVVAKLSEPCNKKKVVSRKKAEAANSKEDCSECSTCDLKAVAAASREQFMQELFGDEKEQCTDECKKCLSKQRKKELALKVSCNDCAECAEPAERECAGKKCPNRAESKSSTEKKKKESKDNSVCRKCTCRQCDVSKEQPCRGCCIQSAGTYCAEVKQRQPETPDAVCCCVACKCCRTCVCCCRCCMRKKKKKCTKDSLCSSESCKVKASVEREKKKQCPVRERERCASEISALQVTESLSCMKGCKEAKKKPRSNRSSVDSSQTSRSATNIARTESEIECMRECCKKKQEEKRNKARECPTVRNEKKNRECPVVKAEKKNRECPAAKVGPKNIECPAFKVAYCAVENTLPNQRIENDDAISIDKYIMVNDVSAQAEFSEKEYWEKSFEVLLNETSHTSPVDIPTSSVKTCSVDTNEPTDSKEAVTTSQKVRVDPFSPSFLQSIQQQKLTRTVHSFSIPAVAKQGNTDSNESTPDQCMPQKNSCFEKKHVATKMKFDWRLMRRKKLASPVKNQRSVMRRRQSTSSEGEVNCECSLSIGEIHPCKQNTIGPNGSKMCSAKKKQMQPEMHVSGQHKNLCNKNVVSYYISTNSSK